MSKKRRCIYCGTQEDLSESDIIPDALTNARITNKNVCRVEHNNKFSDLFETQVIEALAFITNELDVKSRKSKNYAEYEATISIEGIDYDIFMASETDVFNGRVLKSTDKKNIMTSYEKATAIAKDLNKVDPIDVNNIVIEKKVKINLEIYFDKSIFRLAAKIAFEWYCAKNDVSGYHDEFTNIISFITSGTGKNPVSILQNEELYDFIDNQSNLGSHCLFAFQDTEGRINVVIYLFGIIMYRVIVAEHTPEFCDNNLLYQELCTDSSRKEIIKPTIEDVEKTYLGYLTDDNNFMSIDFYGMKIRIPTQISSIDVVLYKYICNVIKCFKNINEETKEPNNTIIQILLKNIRKITEASLLHKKSLKRFVKEHFKEGHEPIKLNPNSINIKDIFLYYILMAIGKSDIKTIDDNKLQELTKELFEVGPNTEIKLDNELAEKLKIDILDNSDYQSLLEQGALVINQWS